MEFFEPYYSAFSLSCMIALPFASRILEHSTYISFITSSTIIVPCSFGSIFLHKSGTSYFEKRGHLNDHKDVFVQYKLFLHYGVRWPYSLLAVYYRHSTVICYHLSLEEIFSMII